MQLLERRNDSSTRQSKKKCKGLGIWGQVKGPKSRLPSMSGPGKPFFLQASSFGARPSDLDEADDAYSQLFDCIVQLVRWQGSGSR